MTLRALITGVAGQDGAYLAALLLKQGYEVFGSCRAEDMRDPWRFRALGIEGAVKLVPLDMENSSSIHTIIADVRPAEIYNLAAQSFVGASLKNPLAVMETDGLSASRLLAAIQKESPETRFFQASTAELFGNPAGAPQNEQTPFHPRNPYGVAKLAAHWATVNARECFGLFACSGILYNHESPLRGPDFVTRKITATLAKIKTGHETVLSLGNLDARRDWGFAGDYVKAMWMMLRHAEASDYVLATGATHSVRDFVEHAARFLGFSLVWEGSQTDEVGRNATTGKILVNINPDFYRPLETEILCGDASKASRMLGWKPEVSFAALVEQMAAADLRSVGGS